MLWKTGEFCENRYREDATFLSGMFHETTWRFESEDVAVRVCAPRRCVRYLRCCCGS